MIKILGAPNRDSYVWRTVDSLAKNTHLSRADVLAELDAHPQGILAVSAGKTG